MENSNEFWTGRFVTIQSRNSQFLSFDTNHPQFPSHLGLRFTWKYDDKNCLFEVLRSQSYNQEFISLRCCYNNLHLINGNGTQRSSSEGYYLTLPMYGNSARENIANSIASVKINPENRQKQISVNLLTSCDDIIQHITNMLVHTKSSSKLCAIKTLKANTEQIFQIIPSQSANTFCFKNLFGIFWQSQHTDDCIQSLEQLNDTAIPPETIYLLRDYAERVYWHS